MKYRLIKTYPGSPVLGTFIDCTQYQINNIVANVHDYLEFWEKVIEKDYEILELSLFRSDKCQIIKCNDNSHEYNISLLNCHGNNIHSIKRLSDGEIFNIGDNTKYGYIDKFYIKSDYLLATTVLESFGRHLNHLEKIKQALFKTEDGVDIFEDDKVVCLYKKELSLHNRNYSFKKYDVENKDYLYFSTKEKAEEYILMNKPCLSLNDYYSVFDEDIRDYGIGEKLKELVKTKIKNN